MADKPPQFEFAGLRFFAARNRTAVTGRVVFPYKVGESDQRPISYERIEPSDPQAALSPKVAMRREAVERYRLLVYGADHLAGETPPTRGEILDMVVDEFGDKFAPRTLQSWIRKHELEGEAGLEDRYTPAPKQSLECTAEQAKDALLVCGWWALRIGNVEIIDTKMMHVAVDLIKRKWKVADLLTMIDCYYSWNCDRQRYPFKSFTRWSRYDTETWALRAADQNDYRVRVAEERVALRPPIRHLPPGVTAPPAVLPARQRRREANDRRTRTAIQNLSSDLGPSDLQPSTSRPSTLDFRPSDLEPDSIAESLLGLEDRWRQMLLRAARGQREDLDAAVATMALWWESMPKSVRNNIDARSKQWRNDHPGVPDRVADRRRVQQLLLHIRDRSGAQRLAVAARLPIRT